MPILVSKVKVHLKSQILSSDLATPKGSELVEGFSYDSRATARGELFFCLSGARTKGVHFIHLVYLKGVRSFVVSSKEQFFFKRILRGKKVNLFVVKDVARAYGLMAKNHLKSFRGTKIAITGSVGKTSLKEILAQALATSYSVYKSQGNFNNHLGVPYSVFKIKRNHDFYVFELGMNHKNEIRYLSEIISPEVTIITSIHSAHIGNFANLQEIALAKSEIFSAQKVPGLVFLPMAINEKQVIVKQIPSGVQLILLKEDDVVVHHEVTAPFKLNYSFYDKISQVSRKEMGVSLYGENYSFALKVAEHFKVDREKALKQMKFDAVQHHRLKIVHDNPLVIDDTYNANFHTVSEALKKLIELKKHYLLNVVLGDILELGSKAKSIYASLAHKINGFLARDIALGRVNFFLLGTKDHLMKIIFDRLKTKRKKYFRGQPPLTSELCQRVEKNSFYYFKASRGVALNQSVEELVRFLKRQN